jgi:predicted nicotinamide N-methyase
MATDARGLPRDSASPADFIRAHLRLAPVPGLPEIRLYAAHEETGLRRLAMPDGSGDEPPAPYWAFSWAGGLALARHVLALPQTVRGRRVLDLGAGSGLVAIAAALAGAGETVAAETNPYGLAAIGMNAAANGVTVSAVGDDLLPGPPPAADLVLAADVFYDRELAARVMAFLDRCVAAGIEVLIGDPGRAHLPRARLRVMAEYQVADVGDAAPVTTSMVLATLPPSAVDARLPGVSGDHPMLNIG